jgi:hypothetical protein
VSGASIHSMGEPSETVGSEIVIPTRVRSEDYGKGSIVADYGPIGIQIFWDNVIKGTVSTHLLTHDRSWVARLEKLPPE